jgi:hypothetical protein
MFKHYEIFKQSSGPSSGKALLNHTIFSPSQTDETVPLNRVVEFNNKATVWKYK